MAMIMAKTDVKNSARYTFLLPHRFFLLMWLHWILVLKPVM